MGIFICPVCGQALDCHERVFRCERGHSFDIAKEGYVNLLSSNKSGDATGDNRTMARSRRDFLDKGYFAPLAEAVCDLVNRYSADGDSVLDVCCGEGYYTDFLSRQLDRQYYGFDLSKSMVRLAAKRRCGARFFVANNTSIPLKSGSVKAAFHLFAPFHAAEFSRVIADDGVIITAVAGKNHLFGLKRVLYDTPYFNDEQPPAADGLRLADTVRVRGEIELPSQEDISALFKMTPYYYHTPSEGMRRSQELDALTTEIEFVIYIYKK